MALDDRFFKVEKCERCGEPLISRIMSWFNDQVIGPKCQDEEIRIKQKLAEQGLQLADFEDIGYVPKVD